MKGVSKEKFHCIDRVGRIDDLQGTNKNWCTTIKQLRTITSDGRKGYNKQTKQQTSQNKSMQCEKVHLYSFFVCLLNGPSLHCHDNTLFESTWMNCLVLNTKPNQRLIHILRLFLSTELQHLNTSMSSVDWTFQFESTCTRIWYGWTFFKHVKFVTHSQYLDCNGNQVQNYVNRA